MAEPVIALLTDFGGQDGFVGIMKGVIHGVLGDNDAAARLVDISHGVRRQSIEAGSWVLDNSYRHFPPGTVFLCVVDPKVGDTGQHKLMAVWEEKQWVFVAPDNGLLSPVFEQADYSLKVFRVENEAFLYKGENGRVSQTFHGRDVYAPVAAHAASALYHGKLSELMADIGSQTGDMVKRKPPVEPTRKFLEQDTEQETYIEGRIEYIDVYGNLITNIPADWLSGQKDVEIQIIEQEFPSFHLESYIQGEGLDKVFLVPGSHGTAELCLFGRSAAEYLEADAGAMVTLRWQRD